MCPGCLSTGAAGNRDHQQNRGNRHIAPASEATALHLIALGKHNIGTPDDALWLSTVPEQIDPDYCVENPG
jgi:hypothetical protein